MQSQSQEVGPESPLDLHNPPFDPAIAAGEESLSMTSNVEDHDCDPPSDADEVDCVKCPVCKSTDECEHMLLGVDETFREVLGGVMFASFLNHWNDVTSNATNLDFDEHQAFQELLEEVRAISDFEREEDDSSLCSTSRCTFFYCRSGAAAESANDKWTSRRSPE